MFNKLLIKNESHFSYFYQNAAQEAKALKDETESREIKRKRFQIQCRQLNKRNSSQLINSQQ